MGTQEVRWDKGGTVQADDYTLIYGKRNENQLGTGSCVERKIISAVKRVEFVGDRMSYTVLRGCWCGIVLFSLVPHHEHVGRSGGVDPLILSLATRSR